MENKSKKGFLSRPIVTTGAAAIALGIAAFGAGQILSPHNIQAEAIKATAPLAASNLPSFADLVDRVSPAVVSIEVKKTAKPSDIDENDLKRLPPELREFFKNMPKQEDRAEREIRGGGSGFFISSNGHIVTNNHVVEGVDDIIVTLKDGRELKAKIIGTDERTDLSVLKVEGNGFKYVEFEPNTNIRVGDWVVAIGNPFGLGGTATAGIVSGLGRENVGDSNIADFIQIDAPINPGNSGGPTFDMKGRVIGVNTSIFSQSGGNIGIGFAVPANIAQKVTQQIIKGGNVKYGWLGVGIQDVNREIAESFGINNSKGALVGSINSNSPAAKSGIKRGDVIVGFDGKQVESASDLTRKVGATPTGTTVQLGLIGADGKSRNVKVTIAQRPSEKTLAGVQEENEASPKSLAESAKSLGMSLTTLSPQIREKLKLEPSDNGLLVSSIDTNSKAYQRGIREGYAILEVNGKTMNNAKDFQDAVSQAKSQNRKSIGVYVQGNEGRGAYVPLPIE